MALLLVSRGVVRSLPSLCYVTLCCGYVCDIVFLLLIQQVPMDQPLLR